MILFKGPKRDEKEMTWAQIYSWPMYNKKQFARWCGTDDTRLRYYETLNDNEKLLWDMKAAFSQFKWGIKKYKERKALNARVATGLPVYTARKPYMEGEIIGFYPGNKDWLVWHNGRKVRTPKMIENPPNE